MKINASFIKIMRHLLIGIILLVLLAVLYDYLQNRRSRNGFAKETPQILSSDTVRSMEDFDHWDYREGVLHFKIHAQKLLESDDKMSHLEGIEAFDLDPDGSIRNEIRSQFAVYDQRRKIVKFSGDVQLFLGSKIELRTNSLYYDLKKNIGSTEDAIQFYADEASGTARGVRFDQKRGLLDLTSEVDFVLTRENALSGRGGKPDKLHATSEKAHFSESANRMVFDGRARIQSNSGTLTGDRIVIILEPDPKSITSMHAAGNASYRFNDAGETRNLSGDRMVFTFDATGTLERIRISTQAMFSSTSAAGEFDLKGSEIVLGLDKKQGSLNDLRSRSDVSLRMKNGLRQTLLSGEQLRANFNPETSNVQSLRVLERAGISIVDSGESPGNELQADEIRMSFFEKDGRAVMENLRAEGSARWHFAPLSNDPALPRKGALPESRAWALTASLIKLLFSSEGDFLESGSASGNVVISRNSVEPFARAQVRRLHADDARFGFFPETNQPRYMNAEGNVRVIYERKTDRPPSSGGERFRSASDKLRAVFELKNGTSVLKSVRQSDNFTYQDALRSVSAERCDYDAAGQLLVLTGSPKILDEMSVTTGERVEYHQKQKEFSVFGQVRSILGIPREGESFFGSSSSSSPVIITAEEMHGTEDEYIRYSAKVQLLSESQHLQAQMLEIFGGGERVEAQGKILHIIFSSAGSNNILETDKFPDSTKREPMIIRSGKLNYSREDKALAYSGNVRLESGDLEVSSNSLDAELDDEEKNVESAIARGSADGGEQVFIRQGGRECRGDIAYWYLDPGKFEVIGNPAEAYDPERGRSSAHRLTYFTADDRIRLESR